MAYTHSPDPQDRDSRANKAVGAIDPDLEHRKSQIPAVIKRLMSPEEIEALALKSQKYFRTGMSLDDPRLARTYFDAADAALREPPEGFERNLR